MRLKSTNPNKPYFVAIICVLFAIVLNCNAAEALNNKKDNQTGNLGLYYTSEDSNSSGYKVSIGNNNGVISIREITFAVRRIGSNSSSKFTLSVGRELSRYTNRPYTAYFVEHYSNVFSQSFSDTSWHEYTVTVPDSGYDTILLLDGDSYYNTGTRFQVELKNVKYYDYTNTYTIEGEYNNLTKKIDFYLVSTENLPALYVNISGTNGGGNYSTTSNFNAGSTLIYSDSSVTTDKYYSYTTQYGFAAYWYNGMMQFSGFNAGPSFTIYTFSDAYYAKEAAERAEAQSINAYTAANEAKNNSWYTGTYGGSPESVGNIAGYIRSLQYFRWCFIS